MLYQRNFISLLNKSFLNPNLGGIFRALCGARGEGG